jgi:hypothetical protein
MAVSVCFPYMGGSASGGWWKFAHAGRSTMAREIPAAGVVPAAAANAL